ncbi:hypothetical protein RHSIM_RhsimUnG0064900 [Rhododendron simsii]|uniref:Uncharacterized protein n=1 Tax=Rhododendron simsii TaxID=118357 RepID=A0A834L5B8_RHOSS|nr:hypothetical protein RHSIM_RhsimUnG0064900 [Rhododendron simsii]
MGLDWTGLNLRTELRFSNGSALSYHYQFDYCVLTGSGVAVSCLACFKRKGSLYRFEYGVTKFSFRLHIRGAYPRWNYCEDFALYCKTGLSTVDDKGRSGQIADLVNMLPKKIKAKYFSHCVGRYADDIGVRVDVIKVPVEDLDNFHHGFGGG